MKEADVKAVGKGLSILLKSFAIISDKSNFYVDTQNGVYKIINFSIPMDYTVSVFLQLIDYCYEFSEIESERLIQLFTKDKHLYV